MRKSLFALAAASLLQLCTPALAATPAAGIELSFLSRYSTGLYDKGGAEIPTYDAASKRLFVVNLNDRAVDVLDISNPAAPTKVGALDIAALGQAANSVAAKNGVVAVAVEAVVKTDPGLVAFYDAATLALLRTVPVGALPDMLTWTPDGSRVLVANEGEPNDDLSIDPEGSISIIDGANTATPSVRHVGFAKFNHPANRASLLAQGVRLFTPGASTAQDLEPEYITVSPNGKRAWVTLQEANAIATLNVDEGRVVSITALGAKDHSLAGQGLDPSDKDNANLIGNWPVYGYYMPDAITNIVVGGVRYLITANEGDSREYSTYNETARVKDLALDPTAFPNAATLKTDAQLGRLTVTKAQGDTDGDGDYDRIYTFGGRSFSVWSEAGALLWDSGDDIEQQVLAQFPANFNAGHTTNSRDDRSDNKGPEPEGLTVANLWGKPYLFLGLERISGVMVYDLSKPLAPSFVQYINSRDFSKTPKDGNAGDLGPEGLIVIGADESPTGKPLLVVANEVSGTTAIYSITPKN